MKNTICLDKKYSTTRLIVQEKQEISRTSEDKFETVLFLPEGENRKGKGGLRTKGYFKKSFDDKPLISIITVVFNGEKYLEETIQSVINQTYDNVEYIIIDGGSTDGTLDIIKKYEDKIDYWVSEKDRGISNAFNKGLNSCLGEWIVMLNAGDWYCNSNILKNFAENYLQKDLMFVYGDFMIIDQNTKDIIRKGNVEYNPEGLKFGLVLPHPCLFSSRNYFNKFGLFNESFHIAMDYEWMLRGIREVKILHISEIITKITDGGISTQNQKVVIEEILKALKINKICSKVCLCYIKMYFYSRFYIKIFLIYLNIYDKVKK